MFNKHINSLEPKHLVLLYKSLRKLLVNSIGTLAALEHCSNNFLILEIF